MILSHVYSQSVDTEILIDLLFSYAGTLQTSINLQSLFTKEYLFRETMFDDKKNKMLLDVT
jgi:hypothetical protein